MEEGEEEKEEQSFTSDEVESITKVMEEGEEEDSPQIAKAQFVPFQENEELEQNIQDIEVMNDVKIHLEVVLGSVKKSLNEVLAMGEGTLVELDKLAGEPVDIRVNDKLIAHGEIVIVDDNFGVKILDIVGLKKEI